MNKLEDGWEGLNPDQYAEGVLFTRERDLPVEYGTHRGMTPNLHILRRTDDSGPQWDEATIEEFERALDGR